MYVNSSPLLPMKYDYTSARSFDQPSVKAPGVGIVAGTVVLPTDERKEVSLCMKLQLFADTRYGTNIAQTPII